jgi:hypothetical protein
MANNTEFIAILKYSLHYMRITTETLPFRSYRDKRDKFWIIDCIIMNIMLLTYNNNINKKYSIEYIAFAISPTSTFVGTFLITNSTSKSANGEPVSSSPLQLIGSLQSTHQASSHQLTSMLAKTDNFNHNIRIRIHYHIKLCPSNYHCLSH